jgi:Zn-dependent peptidase ImmA (M78 family)
LIDVPHLKTETIEGYADKFLDEHGIDEIPVDIEWIIENKYGIDIIPTPSLRLLIAAEGFVTCDGKSIYVDNEVYARYTNRYRFTLAHEMGHLYIHGSELSQCDFRSIEEWRAFVKQVDPVVIDRMEYQANGFAGRVLVPTRHLSIEFDKLLPDAQARIQLAKRGGLRRSDYLPAIRDFFARQLAPPFEVSTAVVERRLDQEQLLLRLKS